MIIVLLPGLDGTGELFKPLIKELPSLYRTKVISYDLNKKQSYTELVRHVIKNLPKEDFILVAESFSGPIAYQVALTKQKYLKSLIVVATFLENPRPFLLKFIPSSILFNLPIPTLVIRLFLLGFSTKIEIIDLFKTAMKKVSSKVIVYRLKEISQLKIFDKSIEIKTIYIQASKDKLVSRESLKEWQKVCEDINVFQVFGEHLILQSNPIKCAEIVTKEIHLISTSTI